MTTADSMAALRRGNFRKPVWRLCTVLLRGIFIRLAREARFQGSLYPEFRSLYYSRISPTSIGYLPPIVRREHVKSVWTFLRDSLEGYCS